MSNDGDTIERAAELAVERLLKGEHPQRILPSQYGPFTEHVVLILVGKVSKLKKKVPRPLPPPTPRPWKGSYRMTNVRELTRGWANTWVRCLACLCRWQAVHPIEADTASLECPKCGATETEDEGEAQP